MKRRLFTYAMFLLFGAVFATGVSVCCGLLVTEYKTAKVQIIHRSADNRESVLVLKAFGSEYVLEHADRERLMYSGIAEESRNPSGFDWSVLRKSGFMATGVIGEEAQGWPMRCFRHYMATRPSHGGIDLPGDKRFNVLIEGGTMTGMMLGGRAIAIIPIWHGLVVDSLFYAALLLLATRGPLALRRHLRRKRGLCVACGYDLRHADHDACPECGAVIGRAVGAIG